MISRAYKICAAAGYAVQEKHGILAFSGMEFVVGYPVHGEDVAIFGCNSIFEDWVSAFVDNLGLEQKRLCWGVQILLASIFRFSEDSFNFQE